MKLKTVNIGDRVTRIPAGFLLYCDDLHEISFPASVVEIGTAAFMGCSGLTDVFTGHSVETIGDFAFADCSGLTSIVFGRSVTSIGEGAFSAIYDEGPQLQIVGTYAITPPAITEFTFDYFHYQSATLYVPIIAIDDYANAEYWKYFSKLEPFDILVPGDVNNDGFVNIDDVTSLIDLLLRGSTLNNDNADVDQDGSVNIGDVTALIDMLLSGH